MGEKTGISWTHHTFNGWTVCTKVSEGCDNCYALTLGRERFNVQWGQGVPRMRFKGTWKNPLRWNNHARSIGERRRVFCMSLADWADAEVPQEWRDEMWQLIRETPWLDWQLLTKRHMSMSLFPEDWRGGYPNVWLGVSVENRKNEYRIENLMSIPAKVHWVSAEPLLEDLDWVHLCQAGVKWIVVGGESTQDMPARFFDPMWADNAIETGIEYGVKIFIKQMGSNSDLVFRDKHGADPLEWPENLRVQEFPN